MKNLVSRFAKNESGATAIEYALIAGLMGVALIVIMGTLTDDITEGFGTIGTAIKGG
jgi:pilus assembly protein Flp/PilA